MLGLELTLVFMFFASAACIITTHNVTSSNRFKQFLVSPTSPQYEDRKGYMVQYRPGDILIGGMLPVHKRGDKNKCGDITETGIQAIETINMVIDQINSNSSILPGIKLGTVIIDTCDVDTHALQRVVVTFLPLLWKSPSNFPFRSFVLPAVVGAAASSVSMQTANLLQIFKVPQVSPWSTHPDLSNKARFPYFFRAVPSDAHQATAMMEFVTQKKWKYISVVYEDDAYGIRGFRELTKAADKREVCIATALPVTRNPDSKTFDNLVLELLKMKRAKVVIVFTKQFDAANLIAAAHKNPQSRRYFVWIGSDGWAAQIPTGNTDLTYVESLEGAIGFIPSVKRIPALKSYMTKLTMGDHLSENMELNLRNPWFPEYLSKLSLHCSIKNETSADLDRKISNTRKVCERNARINESNFFTLSIMQNTADSVFAIVESLKKYVNEVCGEDATSCENISEKLDTADISKAIYHYMKNVTFTGINGDRMSFDEHQDGPAIYTLTSFRRNKNVKNNLEQWKEVGVFHSNKITWNEEKILQNVTSVCSLPCPNGNVKKTEASICCWQCQPCSPIQYVSSNGSSCVNCPLGQAPTEAKDGCVLRVNYVRYDDVYHITSISLAVFGIIMTLPVVIIFYNNRETPIVKASSRELCTIILLGAIMCFLNSFILASPASFAICTASRILLSFGPTLMYAGLLTKTIRVVLIFKSKKILSKQVKTYLYPRYQVLITCFVISIQAAVLIIWFAFSFPGATAFYPVPTETFFACNDLDTVLVLVGLAYPFLLIIACTILATMNRKVPTGFNETKYVGFTMYAVSIIWLAFLSIYFTSKDISLKVATISMSLSLSAITVLVCLFYFRCYAIIFKPLKNTTECVMSSGQRRSTLDKTVSQVVRERCEKSSQTGYLDFN